MIYSLGEIGHHLLKKLNEDEKYNKILESLMIVPNEPKGKDNPNYFYEAVINLNTKDNKIELKMGNELSKSKKVDFSAFPASSPNAKKNYFSTNALGNLIFNTVPDIIAYIEENLNNAEKYSNLKNYLQPFLEKFYIKLNTIYPNFADNEYYLDFSKLDNRNLIKPEDIIRKVNESVSKKDIKKKIKKEIENIFSNKFLSLYNSQQQLKKINIFSLKIDEQYIHENEKFKQDYLDIIYHQYIKHNFEKGLHESLCFICNQIKQVTGKIDIPTKFYITDKAYFFENGDEKNAYKSFGICEDCYQNILVGTSYIQNELSNSFFGIPFYIFPKKVTQNFESKYEYFKNILHTKSENVNQFIENNENIIHEIEDENLKCDFLFYEKSEASFKVVDIVPEVKFSELIEIIQAKDEVQDTTLHFSDLKYLFFPTEDKFKRKIDPKIYKKEFIGLFHGILKKRKISPLKLIRNFIYVNKHAFYADKTGKYDYDVIKVNEWLTLFYKLNMIKEKKKMTENLSFVEIQDKEIKRFFDVHKSIYGNATDKQGLVLLGILINSILIKQKNNENNITFMRKINFEGIPPKRVIHLINDVTKFLQFYSYNKKSEDNNNRNTHLSSISLFNLNAFIYQAMMDRLQSIQTSSLTPEEVVFYLLTGIALGKYIRENYNKNNENQEGEKNE